MKDGAAEFPTDPAEFLKYRKPNEEELKVYSNCLSGAYFKAGVPFAMFSHFLSSALRKPGSVQQPRPFLKSSIIFIANSIFGTFLFFPFCYSKFSTLYMNNIKKEQEEGVEGHASSTQLTEKTLPPSSIEDFSYPTDAVTQFNDSDSNFSSDFNYSKLIEDDSDHSLIKSQTTTYGDLRARHRNEQTKPSATPGSSLNVEKAPSTLSAPLSKVEGTKEPVLSPRPVKKNIYGDEIE